MTATTLVVATLRLTRALEDAGFSYVIGGAIALTYWANPRATRDIDITIDVGVIGLTELIATLRSADFTIETERTLRAAERGDFGFHIDGIRVDAFLPESAHTVEALDRRVRVPFSSSNIFVMSKEDLIITKLIFGRGKDFVDLEAIAAEATPTDNVYVDRWIAELFEPGDSRVTRYREIETAFRL